MTDAILRDLSVGVLAVSLAAGAAILVGASWYDIVQTKRAKEAKKPTKGRQLRPLVSVVIYSQNQAPQTLACLTSVLKSSQRKLEVIVINNGSSDETKMVLKEFVSSRSKRAIRTINKRQAATVETAVKTGLRAAKGDVILVVGSQRGFDRLALAKAANALGRNPGTALIPATWIDEMPSALNLWLRFKSLLGLNWQKTASLLKPTGSGLHFGVFYSRQMVKKPKTDQDYQFASDIILTCRPELSLSSPTLAAHGLAVASKDTKKSALRPLLKSFKLVYKVLALPIFTWYALYLAMNQGYSYLLFISWAIFSFIFVFVIWTTDYLAYRSKARLTALAPAVFSLAVIMVFVEAAASVAKPLVSKISGLSTKVRLAT